MELGIKREGRDLSGEDMEREKSIKQKTDLRKEMREIWRNTNLWIQIEKRLLLTMERLEEMMRNLSNA
jgi:hypothetical protein